MMVIMSLHNTLGKGGGAIEDNTIFRSRRFSAKACEFFDESDDLAIVENCIGIRIDKT